MQEISPEMSHEEVTLKSGLTIWIIMRIMGKFTKDHAYEQANLKVILGSMCQIIYVRDNTRRGVHYLELMYDAEALELSSAAWLPPRSPLMSDNGHLEGPYPAIPWRLAKENKLRLFVYIFSFSQAITLFPW